MTIGQQLDALLEGFKAQEIKISKLEELMIDYIGQIDDEIRGYQAAAKFIGVSISTLERLVREKRIPYAKHGKAISFSRKDLVVYKRSRRLGDGAYKL